MVFVVDVLKGLVGTSGEIMKLGIVIPAYNEKSRIGEMLSAYLDFFSSKSEYQCTFIVVLNGCTDNTLAVVQQYEKKGTLIIIDLKEAGKGLAVKRGFKKGLEIDAEIIGFVDADMATQPNHFYDLIEHLDDYDGVIASRYMKESKIFPPRPFIKEWGRRLVYQPLIWLFFGLRFKDYQCGAKIFRRKVIEKVAPLLTVKQWAFDVELLYLCKKLGFKLREWPTVWHDQADSKLKIMKSGLRMLSSLFTLRWRHSSFGKKIENI